jgi:hypothetical protein
MFYVACKTVKGSAGVNHFTAPGWDSLCAVIAYELGSVEVKKPEFSRTTVLIERARYHASRITATACCHRGPATQSRGKFRHDCKVRFLHGSFWNQTSIRHIGSAFYLG